MMTMGKHTHHLRVIATAPMALPGIAVRAFNPHLPPPVSVEARRELFGGFASMLLLLPVEAGASKAAELDAELLACWAEAEAINTRADAIWSAVDRLPEDEPEWEAATEEAYALLDEYHAAVARAVMLPARTPEGLRAKAGLVLSYLRDDANSALIALSLARDVMGRA